MAKKLKNMAIVSINRVSGDSFKLDGNKLSSFNITKANSSKEFYISYISNNNVTTAHVEIPKTTPAEEIDNMIIVETYKELSLDPEADYKIVYTQSDSQSPDNQYFNVFVVNNDILVNDLYPVVSNTGYIDYLAYAPFLVGALYKRGVLQANECDCFIYFQKNDAFLVVYKNGEYFQTRNVRFNLKYICDKFSELTGNRVDENDFYAMLKKDGINFENPMERDSLIDIFNDIFIYIGDIINSISKVYKTQIKNVFIGSDIGSINGVEIFVEDRLALTYKSFDFDIAVNTKDFEITQLDMLMMLAAQSYLAEPDDEFNFSTFLRPPPFMKRDSGKLFAAVGAGILIGVSMPIYWYGFGYFNLLQTEKKEVELSAATNEKNRIERALSNLDNEIKAVMKKSDGQKAILDDKKLRLTEIHGKKMNYPMKASALYDMSNFVTSHYGQLSGINVNSNSLSFYVKTDTDEKMTELLKSISKSSKYYVTTKLISQDDNNITSQQYESNITLQIVERAK